MAKKMPIDDTGAQRYSRLRNNYNEAFRELIVRTNLFEASDEDPGLETEMEHSEAEVRFRRDQIAAYLLGEQDGRREEQVREAAYFRWLDAGSPTGTALEDWFAAERSLSNQA
jgi:hypothetical protein